MFTWYEIQCFHLLLQISFGLTVSIFTQQHQDSKDIDFQLALTIGVYTGGDLIASNEDGSKFLIINTPNNPFVVDGRIPHKVTVVESGTRFHFIVYRHYQENFPGQHPIYDVAQEHPDSDQISRLDKDGYWVHKLDGLDRIHELVDEFLFEIKDFNKSLKSPDALKVNWLYKEGEVMIGYDDNRYVMQHHVSPELVAIVATAMGPVWNKIGKKTDPILHDFGFLLRTEGCVKQPDHIDGELDNYFAVVPILSEGHRYKLHALKVSDACYNDVY